ncbi:LamG domain-containing protein [Rubripirellula amarantea]|uniref:glycosyl hydrolase n=1 Tax=Rubripirellula amarantea TaxID=2527999 RepID=UPI001F5FDE78|nr:glycosyl hydrolase [Rubripirellula amarantea]
MKRNLVLILMTLVCTQLFADQPFFDDGQDPKPTDKQWQRVESLSDDFDGTELDKSKWSADPAANGWGWIGRPPGLFQESGAVVEEGNLRITVGKLEEPRVINGHEFKYHGAIIRSVNPGNVGMYFEARMKANATEMSSTFWLMTPPNSPRRLELDIQECVGRTTDQTAGWAKNWNQIFHSNMIRRATRKQPEKEQLQNSVVTETKNSQRYYVYGAWWKSPREVRFYLDGKYTYSIKPNVDWNVPSYYQMAIETYDWNPVPDDGGLVASGNWDQRTTQYDWVRTWQLK